MGIIVEAVGVFYLFGEYVHPYLQEKSTLQQSLERANEDGQQVL